MKCCFWCLEKFIKFVNRNAYIMVRATRTTGTNGLTGNITKQQQWGGMRLRR